MSRQASIVGIFSTVGAVLVAVFSVVGSPEQAEQIRSLPIVLVLLLAVAAAVFLFMVPRAIRSSQSPALLAFALSALGLLLVFPAYWSGLPVVLGAGGTVLGQVARERARTTGAGLGRWAVIVGVTAVILDLVTFTLDRLS